MSFLDKVALITGASHVNGIGNAIAVAMGKEGAIVVGTATTQEGADRITERLHSHQIRGSGMVLNLMERGSVDTFIAEAKQLFGPINILVNNAAVTRDNLLLRMKEEQWLEVIEVNLHGIYQLTKACIKDMLKARWGRIIQMGSVVSFTGNVGQANYAAAKAGLIGFSKALALEVASRRITINTVAPGFIETEMTKKISVEHRAFLAERIPMQRFGQVDDVASAVLFLASEAASYITGQILHVNGGMYMGG